jgi:hypothetical protein
MKKLLELEARLIKAKDMLIKQMSSLTDAEMADADSSSVNVAKSKKQLKGDQHKLDMDKDGDIEADDLAALREKKKKLSKIMSSSTTVPGSVNTTGGPSIASQIGFGKAEDKKHEDEKEDKKLIAEAMDMHNEKKHGEKKSKDSAKKDMGLKKSDQSVSFDQNGQWSID